MSFVINFPYIDNDVVKLTTHSVSEGSTALPAIGGWLSVNSDDYELAISEKVAATGTVYTSVDLVRKKGTTNV